MRKLLVMTLLDYAKEPNHRVHQVIRHLNSAFEECYVLYRCKLDDASFSSKTKSFLSFRIEEREVAQIKCFGINHFLNHPEDSSLHALGFSEVEEMEPFPLRKLIFKILYSAGGLLADLSVFASLLFAFFFRVKMRFDVCTVEGCIEGIVGYLLRRFGWVKILVYHDTDPFSAAMNSNFRRAYTAWMENFSIRNADVKICVGNLLADMRRSQIGEYITVIPNGVDYETFRTAQQKAEHPVTLLYRGSIIDYAGIDLALYAIKKLLDMMQEDLQLLIIGDGPSAYERKIRELALQLGLEGHVSFTGPKPYSELTQYLKRADIGLAILKPVGRIKYSCPNKVFEYAAAGLPVIGTKGSETQLILEKYRFGEAIDFNVDSLRDCIFSLLKDKAKYERYSSNARRYAERFDWAKLMAEELKMIKIEFFKTHHLYHTR